MIGSPLTERARRSRLITVGSDLAIALDNTPGVYFPCSLHAPGSAFVLRPPRERDPGELRWRAAEALTAGSRVDVLDSEEWELLEHPSPVRVGTTSIGFRAPVLPLSTLYPRRASLQALGGAEIAPDVPCAVYQPSERDTDRGSYVDYFGEAPLELADALAEPNRQLAFANRTLNIRRAVVDFEVPRVQLELTDG